MILSPSQEIAKTQISNFLKVITVEKICSFWKVLGTEKALL